MELREAAGKKPRDIFTVNDYNKAITKMKKETKSKTLYGIIDYERMMKGGKETVVKLANSLPVVAGTTIGINKMREQ